MDIDEIRERVIRVTREVLGLGERMEIKDGDNFIFDLGAESTTSVQLVAAFEEEFNIEMDNDAALAVQTVGKAVEFIAGIILENKGE